MRLKIRYDIKSLKILDFLVEVNKALFYGHIIFLLSILVCTVKGCPLYLHSVLFLRFQALFSCEKLFEFYYFNIFVCI